MRRRTKARECALQVLYQMDITKEECGSCLEDYWRNTINIDNDVKKFANNIVKNTSKNIKHIDKVVSDYATNWNLDRMAVVDRNILRLATYELLYADDIPVKVSINEAIDIAKKYGDKDSGKFVNGILDKISKKEYVDGKES